VRKLVSHAKRVIGPQLAICYFGEMNVHYVLSLLILLGGYGFCWSQGSGVRQELNLPQVYDRYDLSGEGVVVVVVGRGIDYHHPDFIDEQGQSRVAFIYDMVDTSMNQNSYGVGTIYNNAQLNQSLADGTTLTMDHLGHGTATTGVICGNGSGVSDRRFAGVAPNATIISIKIIQDYFPAFAGAPQREAQFDRKQIPIALAFARDKIKEIGLPSVTVMYMGAIGGPTDGTSLVSRSMAEHVRLGFPVVCGVGDEGGADNHAEGVVEQDEKVELLIEKDEVDQLRLDLWYSEGDRFTISIERPNGELLGPFDGPSGANTSTMQMFDDLEIRHLGANQDLWDATSERRQLQVDFSGNKGIYNVIILGDRIRAGGEFHATLNPATFSYYNKFHSYVSRGTSLSDQASCEEAVIVGNYIYDHSWTDQSGRNFDIRAQGEPGDRWLGSSEGPTQDGRLGVDLMAPGEICFAAYSAGTWYSRLPSSFVQGGQGYYGIQNSTSAAVSLVAGVIALMLELDPQLNPEEIEEILKNSCKSDLHTGPVPNASWGYGKLDALRAIEKVKLTVGLAGSGQSKADFVLFPNPVLKEIFLSATKLVQRFRYEIIDQMGNIRIAGEGSNIRDVPIGVDQLESGLFWIRIQVGDEVEIKRFVKS